VTVEQTTTTPVRDHLVEVREEFVHAKLAPTDVDNGRFMAHCPLCAGAVLVTAARYGSELACLGGRCDRSHIADRVHFDSGSGRRYVSRPLEIPRFQQHPRPPIRGILALLDSAEIAHRRVDATLWLAEHCPSCRRSILSVADAGEIRFGCWHDCPPEEIVAALEHAAQRVSA
jgi:hypothetical protein